MTEEKGGALSNFDPAWAKSLAHPGRIFGTSLKSILLTAWLGARVGIGGVDGCFLLVQLYTFRWKGCYQCVHKMGFQSKRKQKPVFEKVRVGHTTRNMKSATLVK